MRYFKVSTGQPIWIWVRAGATSMRSHRVHALDRKKLQKPQEKYTAAFGRMNGTVSLQRRDSCCEIWAFLGRRETWSRSSSDANWPVCSRGLGMQIRFLSRIFLLFWSQSSNKSCDKFTTQKIIKGWNFSRILGVSGKLKWDIHSHSRVRR